MSCSILPTLYYLRGFLTATIVGIAALSVVPTLAEDCKSYIPDPGLFPFKVLSEGSSHITRTDPDGTIAVFESSISRHIEVSSPTELANMVFGEDGASVFRACDGIFPNKSGTKTLQFGIFSVAVTFTASNGKVDITLDGKNTADAHDGNPCTIGCSLRLR